MKKELDIMIIILLSVVFCSNFYSAYVNSNVYYLLAISLRIILYIFIFLYAKKLGFEKTAFKINKKQILLIPLLLICFSNIIYALIGGLKFNSFNINILEIIVLALNVLIEEKIYRFILTKQLSYNYKPVKAILISSLIFGLVHIFNIDFKNPLPTVIQVLYSFYLGILLATIYLSEDNGIYPIILHLCFNLFNNYLVTNMLNIEYNLLYFSINIIIGLIIISYLFLYVRFINNKGLIRP